MSGLGLVQITDTVRAAVRQELTERAHVRGAPSGPVSDDNMGKLQNFTPVIPLGQAQERIHTDDQTDRTQRKFRAQCRQGIDRVRRSVTL